MTLAAQGGALSLNQYLFSGSAFSNAFLTNVSAGVGGSGPIPSLFAFRVYADPTAGGAGRVFGLTPGPGSFTTVLADFVIGNEVRSVVPEPGTGLLLGLGLLGVGATATRSYRRGRA